MIATAIVSALDEGASRVVEDVDVAEADDSPNQDGGNIFLMDAPNLQAIESDESLWWLSELELQAEWTETSCPDLVNGIKIVQICPLCDLYWQHSSISLHRF